MKKTLLALALITAATGAFAGDFFKSAPTLSVEYNYNKITSQSAHSQYGYVGLAQSTSVGVFDLGAQGTWTSGAGFGFDRAAGWEAGYSLPIKLGKSLRVTPRIAYGALNNIDQGTGTANARYYLASVEATQNISGNLGGYVSYSHLNGVNSVSVARANRVQAGFDYAFTPKFGVRLGASTQRFGDERLNGAVLIGSYNF